MGKFERLYPLLVSLTDSCFFSFRLAVYGPYRPFGSSLQLVVRASCSSALRRFVVDCSSGRPSERRTVDFKAKQRRSSDRAQSKSDGWMRAFDFAKIHIFLGLRKGLGDIFLISRSFFQFTIRNNLFIQPLVLPMGPLKGANGKLTYFWEQITDNSFVLNSFTHS